MKQEDGGPAFPQIQNEYVNHPVHGYIHRAQVGDEVSPGMTLRDYFAAKFMPTAFEQAAQPKEYDLAAIFGQRTGLKREEIAAAFAYRMADAMIARRQH